MIVHLPIASVSEANQSSPGNWRAGAGRRKRQRAQTAMFMRGSGYVPPVPPLTITITRLGKRRMDSDNLAGAAKAIRDGIADWLGMDDGNRMLTWEYAQEVGAKRSGPRGVRVEIVETDK